MTTLCQPAWSIAFAASLCGCTLALDSERGQCEVDADCSEAQTGMSGLSCLENLCVFGKDWSCLDAPPPPGPDERDVTMVILEELTDLPVAGATIELCERLDLDCAAPLTTATTDTAGMATLRMDVSSAYLEITAPGHQRALVSGLNGTERIVESLPLMVEFNLYSDEVFAQIQSLAGVTPLATHGHLDLGVVDCTFTDSPGVSFDIVPRDPGSLLTYIANDLPSATATETDIESSSAFLFNVPAGTPSVNGRVVADGATIGPPVPVIVRAGWLTDYTVSPPGVRVDTGLE